MAATRSPLATDLYITLTEQAWDAWLGLWMWKNKLGWPFNWGYFGPHISLSSTRLLCPSDPLSRVTTGWLQLTECWWETAVWQPPSLPPSTPSCHMIKGIPHGTLKHGWGYLRQEESETITIACTVSACVHVDWLTDTIIKFQQQSDYTSVFAILWGPNAPNGTDTLNYYCKPPC